MHLASAVVRLVLLVLLAGSAGLPAHAQDKSPGLLQMHHTAWSTRDGSPGPVLALAQTPDGWLWLGTPTGLFRFDGVNFQRIDALGGVTLRSSAVRSLAVDRRGALWIGYLYGGASRFLNGALTNYGAEQGLPNSATLARIAVGPDGQVWAAAVHGLFRLAGDKWERVQTDRSMVMDVFVDHAARVWFISKGVLYMLEPAAAAAPREMGRAEWDDASHLTEAPDGSVWVADRTQGLRRYGPEGPRPMADAVPKGPVAPLLFARDGMAWFFGAGLWRTDAGAWGRVDDHRPAEVRAWFGQREGLSGEAVYALLQDREGTVWVGTSSGLDRFRRNKLTRIAQAQNALPVTLAPAAGPDVWVGRSELPLLRIGTATREFSAINDKVSTIYPDVDGSTWVGSEEGRLWRIVDDEVTQLPGPKSVQTGHVVQGLTRDHRGRLWVACAGIFRRDGSEWVGMSGRDGLPDDSPTLLYTDPQGRVWLGFTDSRLAVYEGEQGRTFTRKQNLAVGAVLALQAVGDHLWVGGESGLMVRLGGEFLPLVGAGGIVFHGVSGIVETPAGELWLNTADGIVRIAAAEVRAFHADPAYRPNYEVFDHRDGLEGRAPQLGGLPTLVAAHDGRLWFSTTTSLVSIDPTSIARNPMPAPVSIRTLKAGDRVMAAEQGIALPPLTASVQIEYTAMSLAIPERVKFRYRLEGVDTDWQEAGPRRTAYYTNLGPGHYRFRVMAANDDGVWSDTPATLQFSIAPALYQTLAFRIACVLALLALLAWLYVLRVRTLTARAAEKMRERQLERERIAVELHDTLLQGVYGLLLRMQSVLARMSDEPARHILAVAVERAEGLVNEGRDRVAGLRRSDDQFADLASALPRLAHEITGGAHPHVEVSVEGPVQDLRPEVLEEVYYIAREALLNVSHHAHAQRAEAWLVCNEEGAKLVVRDDGRGIPAEVLQEGRAEGHWGLQGMRERAARIRGLLSIGNREGGGAEVVLQVPRQAAYRDGAGKPGRWAWAARARRRAAPPAAP